MYYLTKMTLISLFDHISTVKHTANMSISCSQNLANVMFTALKHIRELREYMFSQVPRIDQNEQFVYLVAIHTTCKK